MFTKLLKGAAISLWTLYFIRKFNEFRWGTFTKTVDCSKLVVVITGATAGIGLATAEELAARGAHLVLACRDVGKGRILREHIRVENPMARISCLNLDLADLESVELFCAKMKRYFSRVDVLILNAGVWMGPYGKTQQGLELQMGTNHFGHAKLTLGLMDMMQRSARPRLIQLTARTIVRTDIVERLNAIRGHALMDHLCQTEAEYDSEIAYFNSKVAGMLFVAECSRRFSFLRCMSVSPGFVLGTQMAHRDPAKWGGLYGFLRGLPKMLLYTLFAARTPKQGCQTVLYAALDEEVNEHYGYYRNCREQTIPIPLVLDADLSRKLFVATEQIIRSVR